MRYTGCYQITFRNLRDTLNQQCRTTEEISSTMQWMDLVADALRTAKISKLEQGITQTLADVPPRIGLSSTTNSHIHSLQVTGKYEFDIGLTGLVVHAIGLYPNISPFLTRRVDDHPDGDYVYHDPDLLVAVSTMR